MRIRVLVLPWLRPLGGFLLRGWLAITIGHTIIAWRELSQGEMAHELEHARQWSVYGWRFPFVYVWAYIVAWRSGGHWYWDNRFEIAARAAAR